MQKRAELWSYAWSPAGSTTAGIRRESYSGRVRRAMPGTRTHLGQWNMAKHPTCPDFEDPSHSPQRPVGGEDSLHHISAYRNSKCYNNTGNEHAYIKPYNHRSTGAKSEGPHQSCIDSPLRERGVPREVISRGQDVLQRRYQVSLGIMSEPLAGSVPEILYYLRT